MQLEGEGVEIITMDHPAVAGLQDLTFDTPFVLPVTLHGAVNHKKVHVRGLYPCLTALRAASMK